METVEITHEDFSIILSCLDSFKEDHKKNYGFPVSGAWYRIEKLEDLIQKIVHISEGGTLRVEENKFSGYLSPMGAEDELPGEDDLHP
jgi:hypothetical protein